MKRHVQNLRPAQRFRKQTASGRSGAATVELAMTLPVLTLLILGSIEASNAIFLKQAAAVAAYETARVACNMGGTQADAIIRGKEVLTARGISGASIDINPAITAATPRGTNVTVTVIVPSNANSISPQFYYKNTSLTANFKMSRL